MNGVNATALYVSASRAVLQCDPRQPHTFTDMYTLLPFFRQSLSCLVCGSHFPANPDCQHSVCSGCKGQKMRVRLSCNRCKDYSSFQENKQLSLLVQCYRKLCVYVMHSPLLQPISSVGGSPEIMALLDEVLMSEEETDDLNLVQEEVSSTAVESLTPTEASPQPCLSHNYTQIHTDRTNIMTGHGAHTHIPSLDPPPASRPLPIRLNRKRSRSESDREKVKPLPISSILQGSSSYVHTNPSHTLHYTQSHAPTITVPTHTYSSLANGAPSKTSRPAQNHSKGVRKHVDPNPKKPHAKPRSSGGSKSKDRNKEQRLLSGCMLPTAPVRPPYKKPVEKRAASVYSIIYSFAVPEKALEQTRLTLGINLTSITAAAALRNPATTSIRGNTLLNVTTATGSPVPTAFLSPSSPQEPSYEDSLELLIG
uniref:MSL complex subunit 2a n=1 Tax=Neogobius melanostomus TaxID=47308 RepID=A0A8C6UYZ1_9GOBI